MASLNKVRVQLLDENTGNVLQEVDVMTSADAVLFSDGQTFQQKLDSGTLKGATGAQGATGATGQRGSQWYSGTAITGTSTTGTVFSSSGITSALLNDQYYNISTGNVYVCTLAGDASTAKWAFTICLKGPTGATGATGAQGAQGIQGLTGATGAQGPKGDTGATGTRGSQWYSGTLITGTSTTATIFSDSGITSALVGDQYLNTSTGYVYNCTVAGNAATAKWVYTTCLKGAKGDTGSQGTQGVKGDTGATGAQGPKGDKGDTGATGPQGPAGADGASVKFGATYATGTEVKLFLKTM